MTARTVYKYTLFPDEDRMIAGGSPRVVHVGVDPTGDPTLPTVWVELDLSGDDTLALCFIGTGHDVPPDPWRHVGSTITTGTISFVWHVYAR